MEKRPRSQPPAELSEELPALEQSESEEGDVEEQPAGQVDPAVWSKEGVMEDPMTYDEWLIAAAELLMPSQDKMTLAASRIVKMENDTYRVECR